MQGFVAILRCQQSKETFCLWALRESQALEVPEDGVGPAIPVVSGLLDQA
jgi:hypothetical protein